jgi:alkanesulfonate monooxygenase SsuD/methylene tetrahydromethanopterin reductase-like flavin-dependent oxidoreductase (luciferase family)
MAEAGRTAMDFGIFVEEMRKGNSQGDAFREMFDLVDASEQWGLDVVWLAEMLINPARSVLSAPLLVASWIVARTRRLRVGTAVQLLPLNHPIRVAGEITTLDHLSQGRFDFGIGRSGSPRAYDALGVPYAESQARFFEALEIILEAWKGEPFSHHGQFYQFEKTTVTPRPFRPPHPPVRMAATTPDTFPRVGRMGLPIFVGLRGMSIPELSQHLRGYRQAWRDAGHAGDGDVCLRIPVYAADTQKAAEEDPHETITYYFRRQADLTRAPIGRAGIPAEFRQAQAGRLDSLSYDQILTTKVAFGSAQGLTDRLTGLREELSLSGIAAELNPGGLMPVERVMGSLKILTQQVMPTFK